VRAAFLLEGEDMGDYDFDRKLALHPIGYVERDGGDEEFRGPELRERPARIVLDPRVSDALLGLEPGSDVLVLCFFDRSDRKVLQVHPRGNMDRPLRGVFSTRSPARPNPIAVTSVRIESILGNVLHVVGLDALDRTPVVDIKSLAEAFDTSYEP
jgi:tRNA-Thr(GGU) m(6)t(6)A37 methyltransferase TsaA